MKKAFLVTVLLVLASAAHGDLIDPGIIIGGASGSFSVTGTPFSFGPGTGTDCVFFGPGSPLGSGDCIFFNDSGVVWNTLTFFVTAPGPQLSVGCGFSVFFTGCTATALGGNLYEFFFFGGTGWSIGDEALIDIFNERFEDTWPTGTTFQAVANIPEPATMLLTATGLVSFYLRRRLRKS